MGVVPWSNIDWLGLVGGLFREVWYNKNLPISLNFPELFIIGKYAKIRFNNRESPCHFRSSRGQKIKKYYKNWTRETVFVYTPGFIFYGVSHAKTDLHNKYKI